MIYIHISFLTDLVKVSVLQEIFAYLTFVLIGIKKSFLFSSIIEWWNSLSLEIRAVHYLWIFKHDLLKYLQFPTCNYFFYTGDRSASISHTRLRLNFSALKYLLFQEVFGGIHLLKILNTVFCTAQVLPLCVKSCLRPLHNYSDMDSIVLPVRKRWSWQ